MVSRRLLKPLTSQPPPPTPEMPRTVPMIAPANCLRNLNMFMLLIRQVICAITFRLILPCHTSPDRPHAGRFRRIYAVRCEDLYRCQRILTEPGFLQEHVPRSSNRLRIRKDPDTELPERLRT